MLDVLAPAVSGGISIVQFRDKTPIDTPGQRKKFKDHACRIHEFLKPRHIPFLINDHVDIAKEIGADGVHVGQGDASPEDVRRVLGSEAVIGLTAFRSEHFAALDPQVVNYVGTGPVYPTKTDKGKPVLGPEKFAELIKGAPVPVVGIGGITPDNFAPVIEAGAAGVAVMRAIGEADDPELAACRFSKVRLI